LITSYIGQTKEQLSTRVKEHISDIIKKVNFLLLFLAVERGGEGREREVEGQGRGGRGEREKLKGKEEGGGGEREREGDYSTTMNLFGMKS